MFDEDELERRELESKQGPPAGVKPDVTYSIAGTWSGWHRAPMVWDGARFVHEVTIGKENYESFQVLLNGSWERVFYPSIHDGSPWAKCKLRGPDKEGHGRNWTIGRPTNKRLWKNVASCGERYIILVSVNSHGIATKVTWRRMADDEHLPTEPTANDGSVGPSDSGTGERAKTLDWAPPSSAVGGNKQATSRARAGMGHWLVSEAAADLELGDIILLRPGDVVSGTKGLASRGGEVVRMEFVELSHLEEWREAAFSQIATAEPSTATSSKAAVGDTTSTAENHDSGGKEGDVVFEVWRVPDVRGWGHLPAITLKEATSSMKVHLPRGKYIWDLKEAIRAGMPFSVAMWGKDGQDLDEWKLLEEVDASERLFYELYHEVRIYYGGPGNLQRHINVTVKASSTFYDVRAALVRNFWHKYCDIRFVQETESGTWKSLDEDDLLEGTTEIFAQGGFMEDLPAYDVDERAEVHLWDGAHKGKRVACRVEGTSDSGETHDIHILPTSDHDNAGGRSDKYVERIPSHLLRKVKPREEAGHTRPKLTLETALELLKELLTGYQSEAFQQRLKNLLAHYPDRSGYIGEAKYYTGFYTMRKQVLLSLQSTVLPKYGFSKHQGGTVMMVTAIKQFSGDAEIDRIGKEINDILQPMYEEPLS